jgi:hypothetical protein
MNTSLETDLVLLVGELEQVPCDLPQHGAHPIHSEDPASHYVRAQCPHCETDTGVMAACPGYVAAVRANVRGKCPNCEVMFPALDMVTILCPVSP